MNQRFDLIDFYRGISIILVIIFHYTARLPDEYLALQYSPYRFTLGHYGVNLFFAISGFCIYITAINLSGIRVFLVKRFSRIYPAYIFCLTATFVWTNVVELPDRHFGIKDYVGNVFFLGDFNIRLIDGVYWSLLVEIKYYIIFAILFFADKNKLYSRLIIILFIGIAMKFLMNINGYKIGSSVIERIFIISHLPWFILGVGFYCGVNKWSVFLPLTLAIFLNGVFYEKSSAVDLIVFCAIYFLFEINDKYKKIELPNFMRYMGKISFPLYLLHQYVGFSIIIILGSYIEDTYAKLIIAFLIVLCFSHFVSVSVEYNFRRQFESLFLNPVEVRNI